MGTVGKRRKRRGAFGLERVVLVGNHGMLTDARLGTCAGTPASDGYRRCATTRSGGWPRAARSSRRCSTSAA